MYLTILLGAVHAMLDRRHLLEVAHRVGFGVGDILFIQLCVAAFFLLFIWLIARRRKNWARWIWLLLFILGIPLYIPTLKHLASVGLVASIIVYAQNVAQIAALVLIFTGNARDWFRPDKPHRSKQARFPNQTEAPPTRSS